MICLVFDWQIDEFMVYCRSTQLREKTMKSYVHILLGDGASACSTCGKCGSYLVIEGDGSGYPCDFYVLDNWKIGSLPQMTIACMADSAKASEFLHWGTEKPAECTRCPYYVTAVVRTTGLKIKPEPTTISALPSVHFWIMPFPAYGKSLWQNLLSETNKKEPLAGSFFYYAPITK